MITDKHKWHYVTIKCISDLFRDITGKNNGDYYCLNCFHSYRTEDKLKEHELICTNHDYCNLISPDENNKILQYKQGSYRLKMAHAIYVDFECLLVKHDSYSNNPYNSYSKNISTHVPSGYSICVVNEYKDNYHTHYRGEDCMIKLSKKLIEIGNEICNEEKHPEDDLTLDEEMKYANAEICYICEKSFNTNKKSKYYKNYKKVRDHCRYTGKYRGSAHSLYNLSLSEQRDIPIILHNGSNYNFHLLMKDLAKENLKDIRCLGENTEKYISFSVKINNPEYDEEDMDEYKKPLSYCLRFNDSFRFMSRSLDTLTDNFPEINNKTCVKCKERENLHNIVNLLVWILK